MRCAITLKPHIPDGQMVSMDVALTLEGFARKAGEELFRAQIETVSIPGCMPEHVIITDDEGVIPFTTNESKPYPYHFLHHAVARNTQGAVCITYTVEPRPFRDGDRCGPYFDLKAEEGGASSAGLSFLPDIEGCEGEISLHWDLADCPEGSTGICTFGEGDLCYTGSIEKLRQSYYIFGLVHSIGEGDFGFHWLTAPTFDVQAIADYARDLFGKMSQFFRDDEKTYRIIMRKDPYPTSGGTALLRSYMFGWNEVQPVSVADKQNLLAHEMVHNWPHLNDHPYGITSWYSEGTAEYYCVMLPFRMGLVSKEATLKEIQTRTDAYYTNPTRHLENIEAAKICWQDRRAQRLPYGRGFFFLANTDVKVRQATQGKHTIDDVVLSILEQGRQGVTLGNEVFIQTVKELYGVDVTADWETMRTGGHIVPLDGCFDGHFTVEPKEMPEADTGTPVTSYHWAIK